MSIIIRLQNLPISAKTRDIRKFFGGLRIPDGGVHIVGGRNGDAFIAFLSDEDARIAMRRDGAKIKTSKVKLLLSSHMEMQHEIERITQEYKLGKPMRLYSPSPTRIHLDDHYIRDDIRPVSPMFKKSLSPKRRIRQSPIRRRHISPLSMLRSPSPVRRIREETPPRRHISPGPMRIRSQMQRGISPPGQRIRPAMQRQRSPPMKRRRSSPVQTQWPDPITSRRSPIQRMRSPPIERRRSPPIERMISPPIERMRSPPMERMRSPPVQRMRSPPVQRMRLPPFQRMRSPPIQRMRSPPIQRIRSPPIQRSRSPPHRRQRSIEWQQKINKKSASPQPFVRSSPPKEAFYAKSAYMSDVEQEMNITMAEEMSHSHAYMESKQREEYVTDLSLKRKALEEQQMQLEMQISEVLTTGYDHRHPQPPIHQHNNMPESPANYLKLKDRLGYFLILSGLDPDWTMKDIRTMIRGIFISEESLKFEMNSSGFKTGTAFLKVWNEEDYEQLLSHDSYIFHYRIVKVSKCPDHIIEHYFSLSLRTLTNTNSYIKLKNIPFPASVEEILNFFDGFQVADVYLPLDKMGKNCGVAYVSFTTTAGFNAALGIKGRIGTRWITLSESTKEEMLDLKRKNGDLFIPSKNEINSSQRSASKGRSLCVVLTGLPQNITFGKIANFFKEAGLKPDAIHITLNEKGKTHGRAFAEFNSFKDFDSALRCHGNFVTGSMICVKQILFEEMQKILAEKDARHSSKDLFVSPFIPEKAPYIWDPPDEKSGPFNKRGSSFNNGMQKVPVRNLQQDSPLSVRQESSISNHSATDIETSYIPVISSRNTGRMLSSKRKAEQKYAVKDNLMNELLRQQSSHRKFVVQMSGVHPAAIVNELEHFFYGFEYNHDFIRKFDNGIPSGDVRVTFSSLAEAERAIKKRNGQCLAGMPVELFLV